MLYFGCLSCKEFHLCRSFSFLVLELKVVHFQFLTKLLHGALRILELIDTDLKMALQLFELSALLFGQIDEVMDKIEEVSGSDVFEFLGGLRQFEVEFTHCYVDVDNAL